MRSACSGLGSASMRGAPGKAGRGCQEGGGAAAIAGGERWLAAGCAASCCTAQARTVKA